MMRHFMIACRVLHVCQSMSKSSHFDILKSVKSRGFSPLRQNLISPAADVYGSGKVKLKNSFYGVDNIFE